MGCFIRDLVEYCGIDILAEDSCNGVNENLFKQTTIDLNLCVPTVKPDIEQVVKVSVDKEIIRSKVVKTPVGTSMEGQTITGYKYMVMGEFKIKVLYVADGCERSMNSFHAIVPFCEYLVLPEDFNTMSIISPTILVEDVYVRQLDKRCLFGNITFMLTGQMC